jgi:hypothetical protein
MVSCDGLSRLLTGLFARTPESSKKFIESVMPPWATRLREESYAPARKKDHPIFHGFHYYIRLTNLVRRLY